MQVELTSLLDAVQETETKMVEMSALNHLMSTHVLQQAQQIEVLYDQVRYDICFPYFFFVCILSNNSYTQCYLWLCKTNTRVKLLGGSLQLAFVSDDSSNLCHIVFVGELQH